jgi:hypothetical protein
MPTSKADRLKTLFEGDSLPSPPEPNQPHIADTEIIANMPSQQQPWQVLKEAQVPRKITQSQHQTGRSLEQLTSSDDDEYIRAFKKTPTAKPEAPSKKTKKKSSNSARTFPGEQAKSKVRSEDIKSKARNERIEEKDDGIPTADEDGNPLIGRFCPFSLVTKFCYKYMNDPNDRVSKHFFASGKIWERTWTM